MSEVVFRTNDVRWPIGSALVVAGALGGRVFRIRVERHAVVSDKVCAEAAACICSECEIASDHRSFGAVSHWLLDLTIVGLAHIALISRSINSCSARWSGALRLILCRWSHADIGKVVPCTRSHQEDDKRTDYRR